MCLNMMGSASRPYIPGNLSRSDRSQQLLLKCWVNVVAGLRANQGHADDI